MRFKIFAAGSEEGRRSGGMIKCKDCKYSYSYYDSWSCCWVAVCNWGGMVSISGYTENEENAPDWDVDLGHNTKFCGGMG